MAADGTIGEVEPSAKKRFKFPKKLVIAVGAILLLLGGSGGAALYIGTDKILGKSEEELGGLECHDVARVAVKRNDNQIWLHKYISTESTDGPNRIKTAIRVTTGMAEKLKADLIHIVVLDKNGPKKRSDMKEISFGAEVFYVRNPGTIPGFDQTFKATYAVGSAAANGNFYGKRRELTQDQVITLAKLMENRSDCVPTEEEQAKIDAAAKAAEGHGAKPAHEAKPAEEGASKHGEGEAKPAAPADPALAAESKLDEALGIAPPPPPPVEEAKVEPDAGKDKGFLDSMLGMVGLGSKEEAPKEGEAKPADGHGAPAEGEHGAPAEGEHAAPAEGEHGAPAEGEHGAPAEGEHATHEEKLPPNAVDLKIPEKPVVEKSMFDSVLGMVGLGSEEKPADGEHGTPAEGEHAAPAEGEGHGAAAEGEGHAAPAEGEGHATPAENGAAHDAGHSAAEPASHSGEAQTHEADAHGAIPGDSIEASSTVSKIIEHSGGHSNDPAAQSDGTAGDEHSTVSDIVTKAGVERPEPANDAAGHSVEQPAEPGTLSDIMKKSGMKTEQERKAEHDASLPPSTLTDVLARTAKPEPSPVAEAAPADAEPAHQASAEPAPEPSGEADATVATVTDIMTKAGVKANVASVTDGTEVDFPEQPGTIADVLKKAGGKPSVKRTAELEAATDSTVSKILGKIGKENSVPKAGHNAKTAPVAHDTNTTPAEKPAATVTEAPAEEPTDEELLKMKAKPNTAGHDKKAEASHKAPAH